MKKTICFILAFAGILIIACNNPKKDVKESPYIGAWEMTSTTYNVQYHKGRKLDSTFVVPAKLPYLVKLITKKHYAFGTQGVDRITGGGGEYTYEGDTFTSYPKYHSVKANVGNTLVWKSKIEGDLWKLFGVVKNDTVQYERIETWKRIIE